MNTLNYQLRVFGFRLLINNVLCHLRYIGCVAIKEAFKYFIIYLLLSLKGNS